MPARHIFYTGRVQGVGFRYETKNIAKGFEVTGWVRNLPDGRVELFVQSTEATELEGFIDEVEVQSPLAHFIKEKQTHTVPYQTGLKEFTITR